MLKVCIHCTYQTRPADPPEPRWPSQSRPASQQRSYICSQGVSFQATEERQNITNSSRERLKYIRDYGGISVGQTESHDAGYAHTHTQKHTTHTDVTALSAVLFCPSLQRFGEGCTLHLCGPDKTLSLIIHCQKMVLIMGLAPAPSHSVPEHLYLTSTMAPSMTFGNIGGEHLTFFPPVILIQP